MNGKHYAALVGLFGAMGMQLAGVHAGWHEVLTPLFVGGLLVQVSSTIGAMLTDSPAESKRQKLADESADRAIAQRLRTDLEAD
jgi:hypothetical protein